MKTPEGYEKAEIDKYLKAIGAYICKPTTGGFGQSGHSDRICCIDGRFWGIEVKREGKEPTALQARRMSEIEEAGGFAVCGTAEKVIGMIETWIKR